MGKKEPDVCHRDRGKEVHFYSPLVSSFFVTTCIHFTSLNLRLRRWLPDHARTVLVLALYLYVSTPDSLSQRTISFFYSRETSAGGIRSIFVSIQGVLAVFMGYVCQGKWELQVANLS